ncbi:MAG: formyltetrahydrofolate deformylase [bacterium]|nr:formyltetrahydrofolate deformylase [bacterium]
MSTNGTNAILLIHCPDQPGIISSVTQFLADYQGNVVDLDEHVDRDHNVFFMRVEWEMENFGISKEDLPDYFRENYADRYNMKWELYFTSKKPRMALFVTKLSHNLFDVLGRQQSGDWNVEIPLMISNHEHLRDIADRFDIPFHYIPITKENKKEQEKRQLELLKENQIDFIVLARYMQILSSDFIGYYTNKIINIHHSFLPAFPGAKPYHSAFDRGVKIIGATSHYVTSDLDAGPIIEQDVVRVSHKDSVKTLIRKGQDLEKIVLSRAIYAHLQRKVLVFNNKTVVFD